MPYSVNLNRVTISLDQKTQLILELFKKACDRYLKEKNIEERAIAELAVSDKQLKKGIFPKIVDKFENFNEKKYGAGFVTLNQIDNVKLDPKADKILDAYTDELNALFIRNGMNSQDLNQEDIISSAALVFRKLLLRLITIALCNDNTFFRDGEVLLKIHSYFIDQVLSNINKFASEEKIFSYFATKEHVEWMSALRHVVLAVKLIHSHQDNITECLTTLKSLTSNIEAMILAHLVLADSSINWPRFSWMTWSPRIRASDLTEQSITRKLSEYERYLAIKNPDQNSDSIASTIKTTGITTFAAIEHLGHTHETKSILDVGDISENSQIAALIACKNNKCPPVLFQKIEKLYSLYFKSRCLLISLEQIDELITACSWVPLVMGMIDLSQICELMRVHCEVCEDTLSISDDDLVTKLSFKEAILHKAFRIQAQLKEMHTKILALEELQNPVKIQKIKYHISETIGNIQDIQSALEISLLQYNQIRRVDKKKNTLTLFSTSSSAPELKMLTEDKLLSHVATLSTP